MTRLEVAQISLDMRKIKAEIAVGNDLVVKTTPIDKKDIVEDGSEQTTQSRCSLRQRRSNAGGQGARPSIFPQSRLLLSVTKSVPIKEDLQDDNTIIDEANPAEPSTAMAAAVKNPPPKRTQ